MNENEEFEFRLRLENESSQQPEVIDQPSATSKVMQENHNSYTPTLGDFLSKGFLGIGENAGIALNFPLREVPSAGVRALVRGKGIDGYLNAIQNPNSEESFTSQFTKDNNDSIRGLFAGPIGSPRATSGALADFVTNPFDLLGAIIGTDTAGNVGAKILKEFSGSKLGSTLDLITNADALKKAEKLTHEVLGTTTKEVADALYDGSKVPSVQEASKVIRQSKSFDDLHSNIDSAIDTNFKARDAIIAENNRPITDDAPLFKLKQLIKEKGGLSQSDPNELKVMNDILEKEKDFIGKGLDRVGAQKQKEYLQKLTQPYLKKAQMGTLTGNESAEMQAWNALRDGYKDVVESGNPIIRNINDTYDGLLRAKELISIQQAKILNQVNNESILSKAVSVMQRASNPKQALTDFVLRESDLGKKTKLISELMDKVKKSKTPSLTELITNPAK